MAKRDFDIKWRVNGGNAIKVTDKITGLVIVFKYDKPINLYTTGYLDAIVGDASKQMIDIVEQYENFDVYQLIN